MNTWKMKQRIKVKRKKIQMIDERMKKQTRNKG